MFGNECCPRWLSEDRVNLASFSHVGADGANAAQKWARLMKGRIQDATKAHIGTNHWNQLSAIEQARELHVLVTNCCIHGGVLGFSWGSKAGAKLTAELGAAAVASVRDTGRASDHFSHACNLKQALHCGGKLLGCSNGYAYGKAFYFLTVFLRPHFAHIEYIAWPRQNGSRFFGMIRMCAVFLRTREVALEALSNLMVGAGASLSAPNGTSQRGLLQSVRVGHGESLVPLEAHGTGTSLGDPTETAALRAVLCPGAALLHLRFLACTPENPPSEVGALSAERSWKKNVFALCA